MKKGLFIFASFFIIGITVKAQKISIMPKAGIDIYHLQISNDIQKEGINQKPASGFTGGMAINIKVNKFLSLQPEFLYVSKGLSNTTTFNEPGLLNGTYTTTTKLSCIEIPLLVKATYSLGKLNIYTMIGPSLNFALGGKYKRTTTGNIKNASYDSGKIDFEDGLTNYKTSNLYYSKLDYNRTDIGLQLGGGIGYKLGPGTVIFDVRYGLGFVDFETKDNASNYYALTGKSITTVDNTSKYRILALTFGYAIPLIK